MTTVTPSLGRSGWRWLPLVLLVIVADQLSKGWIEANYLLGESTAVLPWLDIIRLHNPGAAFSFLAGAGGWQRWFFIALALGVHEAVERRLTIALSLILAGAIGNVIDRIEHGYVVDFIHVHWGSAYFPAFNIADAALSVGAALMIFDAFLEWRRERTGGGA